MEVAKLDESIPRRILKKLKYPKLIFLVLTFVLAFLIYQKAQTLPFEEYLFSLGILGAFIAGMLFSYGFTAAPATALLLILARQENLFLLWIVASVGAVLSDILIFKFIRLSFTDEISRLSKNKYFRKIHATTHPFLKKYLLPALASFIIASPLPDEIGVALLAMTHSVSTRTFIIMSFILNSFGILVILLFGKII